MRLLNNEDGQALVITTLCMSLLMGMAGLAIEIGLLYRTRQNVQIAADAAAQAAALDYHYNGSVSGAQVQGQTASTNNGFTDGTNGVSVAVNLPPTSGSETGDTNYAEAIVTYPNPVSFMGVFGFHKVNVTARAVAGPSAPGSACIWLMGQTGTDLTMVGSYDLETPGCGIYVNSTSTNAVNVTGNGGTVNAKFLDVRGAVTPQHQTTPTPITTGVSARTPPISPTAPTVNQSSCSTATTITSSNITSFTPDSNNVVCFANAVTISGTVTLPGTAISGNSNASSTGVVYVFENGVTIATGAVVSFGSCTGCNFSNPSQPVFDNATLSPATMDLQGGTLTQGSSSLLSIYAPSNVNSGMNGVAIYQDPNSTPLQIQFGSNNEVLDGWIYAPNAALTLQDSGGGVTAAGIVAQSMTSQTTALSILSYDQFHLDTSPDPVITLVE